jgi:putative restriction endonuclease
MYPDLVVGKVYSKEEIESIFDTKFGLFIRGINLRYDDEKNPYIILFSRQKGPHDGVIIDNVLHYDGEGKDKDQTLTTANKALMESVGTDRPIYGFREVEGQNAWEYLGVLKALDSEYKEKNGFMTYEFKLKVPEKEPEHPPEVAPEAPAASYLEGRDDKDYIIGLLVIVIIAMFIILMYTLI